MRKAGRALLALLAVGFGYGAFVYLTLPDVRKLRTENPGTTAFMELRAREARARGEAPRRIQQWVSYPRISTNLKRAVLAAEDSAFWQHDGVDFEQLRLSFEVDFERMAFARGGSTITQQLAKNLYLYPSKTPLRKGLELFITRRLEAELSKQRIFELYLNVIEWGDGIFGAEAASRTYFHKAAGDLTPSEAALLAAAISSPTTFDPARPSGRVRQMQQLVLRRMGLPAPPPAVAGPAGSGAPQPEPALPDPVSGLPAAIGGAPGTPVEPPAPAKKGPGGSPPGAIPGG